MVCMSVAVLALWFIGVCLFGGCLGALIIYKIEEDNFKAMTAQCEKLSIEEEKLRSERETYKTCVILDTIDDVPEYLRDKYDISEKVGFTDDDEDLSAVYT